MSENNWMNNPKLNNIDPEKLQMLLSMTEQSQGKSPTDMLPLIMAAASQTKSTGMSFSSDEASSIIEVMKMGKSAEEIAKIERISSMMKFMK